MSIYGPSPEQAEIMERQHRAQRVMQFAQFITIGMLQRSMTQEVQMDADAIAEKAVNVALRVDARIQRACGLETPA